MAMKNKRIITSYKKVTLDIKNYKQLQKLLKYNTKTI